jgi:hypothetical protein
MKVVTLNDPNHIHLYLEGTCPNPIDNNFKYNKYIAYLTKDKIPITNTNRNMVILYGIPCSGKSSILNKMLTNKEINIDLTNTIIVDPDAARIFSDDFSKIITGEYYYNTLSEDEKKLFTIRPKIINGLNLNFYLYKGKFIPTYKDSVMRTISLVRNKVQKNFNQFELFNIIYDSSCLDSDFCLSLINKVYNNKYNVYVNLIGVFVPKNIVENRCDTRNYNEGRYTDSELIKKTFTDMYTNLTPTNNDIKKFIDNFTSQLKKIKYKSNGYNHNFYINGDKVYSKNKSGVNLNTL